LTNRSRDAALLAILQDAFDAADDGSETILSLIRKHGGKTGEELKAEGK